MENKCVIIERNKTDRNKTKKRNFHRMNSFFFTSLLLLICFNLISPSLSSVPVENPSYEEVKVVINNKGDFLEINEIFYLSNLPNLPIIIRPLFLSSNATMFAITQSTIVNAETLLFSGAKQCDNHEEKDLLEGKACSDINTNPVVGLLIEDDGYYINETSEGDLFLVISPDKQIITVKYTLDLLTRKDAFDSALKLSIPYIKFAKKINVKFNQDSCSVQNIDNANIPYDIVLDENFIALESKEISGGFEILFRTISCGIIQQFIGEGYSSLIDDLSVSSQALKIAQQSNSSELLLQAEEIYYWTRDNINYRLDKVSPGEDDPATCDETLNSKYGDCEDISILLASMLKVLGFETKLVVMDSKILPSQTFQLKDLLYENGLPDFDHVFIALDIKPEDGFQPEDTVLLDATCKDCYFGQISESDIGKPALVIDKTQWQPFPLPENIKCDGKPCYNRCYKGHGRCCNDKWMPGAFCCNSADCTDKGLCINGKCELCSGKICKDTCYDTRDYAKPCCSKYDCVFYEECSGNNCNIKAVYIYGCVAVIVLILFIIVFFVLNRKSICPFCKKGTPSFSLHCIHCGKKVKGLLSTKNKKDIIRAKKYIRKYQNQDKTVEEIIRYLKKHNFSAEIINALMEDKEDDEIEEIEIKEKKQMPKEETHFNPKKFVQTRFEEGFSLKEIKKALQRKNIPLAEIEAYTQEIEQNPLYQYVEERRKENMTEEKIKDLLEAAGYTAEDIAKFV